MKKLVLFTIIAALIFTFTQCGNKEVAIPTSALNKEAKIEQLQSDPNLLKLVTASNELANVSFEHLRVLGSFKEREKRATQIKELLKKEQNPTNLSQIIKELGFEEKEFAKLCLDISKAKVQLEKTYGINFLNSLSKKDIETVSLSIQSKFRPGSYELCPLCPFNNCDECFPGTGGTGGSGSGGDGSSFEQDNNNGSSTCNQNCLNGAKMKRNGARGEAQTLLTTTLIGCQFAAGGTMISIYQSTWILNALGPEAPALLSVLGGISVDLYCMTTAVLNYQFKVMQIEGDFLIDKTGCGC